MGRRLGQIRVLVIEDNEDDALLMIRTLKAGGYTPTWERVESMKMLLNALTTKIWDVILSDYSIPYLRVTESLKAIKTLDMDVPFIIVSGAIEDQDAVKPMQYGASDFVTKKDMSRLVPAIQREMRDMKIRKEAKMALKLSEERLRLFVEKTPASVAMFDKHMRYVLHSARWLKDYGFENINLIGKSHYEMFPEIGEEWKAIHRRCILGATESREEDSLIRPDGKKEWLKWEIHPWRDSRNEIGGIMMFTEVITKRKLEEIELAKALREAQEANRLKSAFIATMSHELRTPLNAIIGFSDVLLKMTRIEKEKDYLQRILNNGDHLLALIGSILDISKIEAGQFELTDVPFIPAEMVAHVYKNLSSLLQKKKLQFSFKIDPDLPPVLCGDLAHIKQMLINLLSNSIKFTAETGAITVEIKKYDLKQWSMSVKDTGIGIPSDDLENLFTEFHQVDNSLQRSYEGTGLGLAIVRRFATLMGGSVKVESELGKGSTFTVYLPLKEAPDVKL